MRRAPAVSVVLSLLAIVACGGSDSSASDPPSTTDSGTPVTTLPEAGGGGRDSATDSATGTDSSLATGDDPDVDGPFATAEKGAMATIAATGDTVAVHAVYPTGAGPFPVVVIGHGFQLPPSQYYSYAKRLGSFGYVALTVDFPTSFLGNDNPQEAKDMLGGVAWAKADPTIGSKVDANTIGMTGHSLGGKVALLAATMDTHVKAAFVLDPVDGGGPSGCTAPACVTVSGLMPALQIPTGFIGETTDAASSGLGGACAPAASNFTTFYAKTNTPSLEVTALGANHMSFLDDLAGCGTTCLFCNTATATNADVSQMARAFMTAFFERHLRGKTAFDAYLTGAQAQSRYVTTSRATIVSK
jgi:dienelactone hydrolase